MQNQDVLSPKPKKKTKGSKDQDSASKGTLTGYFSNLTSKFQGSDGTTANLSHFSDQLGSSLQQMRGGLSDLTSGVQDGLSDLT